METRLADRLVVTRLDISKLGWTPYVYYTTLHSTPPYTIFRQIYWARELLEKRGNLGEIRVRDKNEFLQKKGAFGSKRTGFNVRVVRSTCYAGREKGLEVCLFERVLPAKGWKEFSFKN